MRAVDDFIPTDDDLDISRIRKEGIGDFAKGILDEGQLFFEDTGGSPIAKDQFNLGESFAFVIDFFFRDGLGKLADGVDGFWAAFAVDAGIAWNEGNQLGGDLWGIFGIFREGVIFSHF